MKENIKILFAEDGSSDRENIRRQIKKDKIEFTEKLVKTRSDYIDAINSFKPDLIISDYSLPRLKGMEALTIRNVIASSAPFIFVSGLKNIVEIVECVKAGADDYILKQNLSGLGEAIKSAIKNKELLKQKESGDKLELIGAKFRAEEGDRLKTAFLHNISHEIRTPLNAIVGFSALLGEPGETDETRQSFVEIIISSSDHLLHILNGIIEISNIEAGILKLNLSDVNLNGILKNLHKQFKAKTDKKGIGFSYETALSDNNAYIQADNTKLIQILSNLLINAIKFTNTGQIELGYNIRNDYLEFYISDTGIGIPYDQSQRIFDRFYQVDYADTRAYEGTGLGLSISKSYVEFMGGRIWMTSPAGRGTVFYFTIPYKKTVNPYETGWERKGTKKIILKEQKAVLIAEDEESNYLLMKEQLTSLNVNVVHVINGKEAVDICAADKKIDLVLMDIKMPVMDGFEATKKIRNFLPDLPIIATTAYAFETDREKALSIGCSDYISKPIGKDVLLEVVNKYLY